MRILPLIVFTLFTLNAFAGDLDFRNLTAEEGGENFSLQAQVVAPSAGDVNGNDYDYGYGRKGSTYDSVDLYNYVRVTPSTKFSISTKNNGFMLVGDFKPETNYKVTLKAGLRTKEGEKLEKEVTKEIRTGSFAPRFTFKSKARYLPGTLQGSIAWEAVNVEGVKFEVRQVFPQNLHQWVTSGEHATEYVSEPVKTVSEKVKGRKNKMTKGTFSLAGMETLGQGVFVIIAKPPPKKEEVTADMPAASGEGEGEGDEGGALPSYYRSEYDKTTVVVTNLTVVAKRGQQEAKVWVMNTRDLKAVGGATVDLVATSNRKLDSCSTSGAGAECTLKWKKLESTQPYALIVKSGKDLTYVRFEDLTLPNDAFQAGKRDFNASAGELDAYIYGERDLYRPGETLKMAVMVRNNKFEAVPKMPVRWTITNPRGKVVRESVSETSEFGIAQTEYPSSAAGETGKYTVSVHSGKNLLHETAIMVEEFVPERIGLKVTPAQEVTVGKTAVPFAIQALYLFGPPVAGGAYKLSCSMKPAFREIPNRPGYATGIYTKEAPQAMTLEGKEGTLDAKGNVKESCAYDARNAKIGEAYQMKAKVDVNESGSGRATTKVGTSYLSATDTLIGLKLENTKSNTINVRGGLFDFKGLPKNGKTTVKLKLFNMREHWYYTYGGYDSWKVEEIITPTAVEKTVEVNGNTFEASFQAPEGWGRWLVRAVDTKTGYTADLEAGYIGWYYSERSRSGMRAAEPSALKVELSKREAAPGDKLEVMVEAPFSGRILFAFETDHAIESRWVDVKKPGQVKIDWKIPNVLPNVYVTALLMKDPVEAGGKRFMPARAWGAASVQIVPSAQRMDVAVVHPELTEGRKTVTLNLSNSAKAATQYEVAVVDEGILQMTDYKSPDPLKRFFEARALGVSSIETMGWTVAVENAGGKNPGGDQAGGAESKNMPVKLVSFWFPAVKSDSSGKAQVQIPLPAFQGKLRVMAVAGGKSKMGSSSTMMTVRDPLVLQSTLPRFLTQGDKFQFPVSVTNLSGKDQNVTVEVFAGEMVALTTVKQQVSVPNGQARVVQFGAEVKGVNGMASIGVKATADKLNSVESFDLPVKPSGIEQTIRLSLDTKQDVTLATYIPKEWRTDFIRAEASVSSMPYLNQMSHLEQLIHYPYGCIEQTTSTTMPLLAMGELLQWIAPKKAAKVNLKDMVNRGIARVISMQTASGGFAYWPGDGTPNPWGTAYATHMLLDAKKLGYEVSPSALKAALDYLETYSRESSYSLASTNRRYEHEAEPFAIYVLAKGGRAVSQELRDIVRSFKPVSQKWSGVRGENYFLLAAAAKLLGDKDSIKTLSDESVFSALLIGDREDDYTYWSPLRSDGLRLSVLEDISPKHPAIDTLAARVALSLSKNDYYYSTQDVAWSVLALGKRLSGMKKPDAAALAKIGLMLNGKKLTKSFDVAGAPGFNFDGANLNTAKLQVTDAPSEKGTFLYVKATGYTKTPPASRSELSVQRTFYSRDGSGADASNIKQGDTVFVELTIQNTGRREVKNVAIVDRVPAGFEIENPRLGKSEELNWMKDAFKAEYQDLRDDRIQVFGDLKPKSVQYIYYSARAVTKGQFTAPASFVEAMYDPANFDYDEDVPVRIVEAAKKK